MTLTTNQTAFIDFLVRSQVLTFGEFVTKSGRHTPYFINTGNFNTGQGLRKVGEVYARHIAECGLIDDIDVVFGPAYKGIPLSVATSIAIDSVFGKSIGFCFDRKEAKEHGDKGVLVGHHLSAGDRVLLVEDVVTAGTTMREVVPKLRNLAQIYLRHVIIAVDRQERGEGALSAIQEVEESLGLTFHPVVTIRQVVDYLSKENSSGLVLTSQRLGQIHKYWELFGVEK
jgi:orotate phosphoribosyltransferase